MKQWQLQDGEGFDRLKLVDVPQPVTAPNEVLVRIHAASLNYRDLLGARNPRTTPGLIPLSDGAGEIMAVGEGVTAWAVGDRVMPTFFREWQGGRFDMRYHDAALGGSCDGVLSEYVAVPDYALARVPDGYSYEEAATLPCAGLTTWCALQRGAFSVGDTVLLQGTGGVSIWGLQLVAAGGGTAIITSSSDAKLERAKTLGAEHGINYKTTPDWDKEAWSLTEKRGVDHVLEVGGPGTLGKSLGCVAAGGHIAQIGVLTGFAPPDASIFPIVAKNATMSGIYVGSRESMEELVRFLNGTGIRPVIDRVFTFAEAREAYDHMESGAHFGKVVISVD